MDDAFYDALAPYHHLIYRDWAKFQNWQFEKLSPYLPAPKARVIDCACGIGTQIIPLLRNGYDALGFDPSRSAVRRCLQELQSHELQTIIWDGLIESGPCGPVYAEAALLLDNYICHAASDNIIVDYLKKIRQHLRSEGCLILGLRDYDSPGLRNQNGTVPAFYDGATPRMVHQTWRWLEDGSYQFYLFISEKTVAGTWATRTFVSKYRPIRRDRLIMSMKNAGFGHCRAISPTESGYHQWLITAISQ